jgi:predicted AAA+ superfamily ATPase
MNIFDRALTGPIQKALMFGKSILFLGARQTGKTTLCQALSCDLRLNFSDIATRQLYEQYPERLRQEIENLKRKLNKIPCVFIDEVQKNPRILDLVQVLIDEKEAQFILTGSSVRKLRRGGQVNLLPGRVIHFELDPLALSEYGQEKPYLESLLLNGSLPGVVLIEDAEIRDWTLQSYVSTYLEEEIREEAQARDLAKFGRFLELASSESGSIINFMKLSSEIGVSVPTITNYFEILEDSLLIHRIEPFMETKTRRQLLKSPKYLLFDLGVRRIAAREFGMPSKEQMGRLFEQWVGLELLREIRMKRLPFKVQFWRDKNGIEVDWIVNAQNKLVPIEVKWRSHPKEQDVKHLNLFLKDYPEAEKGYLIANVPRAFEMSERITVLPWQDVSLVLV